VSRFPGMRSVIALAAPLWLALALSGCRESPSGDVQGKDAAPAPGPSVAAPSARPASSASAAPPAAATAAPQRLVILAGGDVNLARGAGRRILEDPRYNPFRELGPLLGSADLRFVNLESQLSDQGGELESPNNPLIFSGPPGGADVLAAAGIDVVSLANNHAWDYGKSAFLETIANLERAKVRYVGASSQQGRQYDPLVLEVKGFKIALFAVTNIWNQGVFDQHAGREFVAWAWLHRFEDRLKRARAEHDVVLLSYHGGSEYVDVPMTWTRDFVREAMKLGIDAVIGHHPHIPHGVGWFGERPVFYSLGNLVFAMHSDHPWTGTSFMARLTFERGRGVEVEACPYTILGHVPRPFDGAGKAGLERTFARHLKLLSLGLGGTSIAEPGGFGCMRLSPVRRERVATTP
jgi:poly-gamma-glutamate capsule biosynthesis protein CapA/YwtB (metallophosphatase superfamily)